MNNNYQPWTIPEILLLASSPIIFIVTILLVIFG